MMVQSWEDLRSWSGARGQGESKTGWGALPERGKDLGLDSLLYHVLLPFIQMIFIGHLGSVSIGLGGEDILGSKMNFFPRKSLASFRFLIFRI